MSFMGFAGTLGADWCDYLLADKIAIPPSTLRPNRLNVDLTDQIRDGNNDEEEADWVYGENIIFTRDTFFCCDHRQSAPDAQEAQLSWVDEQKRRWRMRKEIFPDLDNNVVILGNFNQLYKASRSMLGQPPVLILTNSVDRADNVSDLAPHPFSHSQRQTLAAQISRSWGT